jgi:hypothetical protein
MISRKKTFDCVDMKNRIQRDLRQEYEARKTEFGSYIDFLRTTANESEEIQTFIKKVTNAKAGTKS